MLYLFIYNDNPRTISNTRIISGKQYLRNMLNPISGQPKLLREKIKITILVNLIIQIIGAIVSKKFSNYDTQY